MATQMIDNGADMAVVQDLLGHSDIKTTRIYARVNTKRMISEYKKYTNFK
jgi:integrase/recombinase XerD